MCYGPGFKRICPHVDSVCVEDTLSDFLPVLSGVLKAALLVHCSSLFILMTFLLVVADDSKCFNSISSTVDCLILHEKINDVIR